MGTNRGFVALRLGVSALSVCGPWTPAHCVTPGKVLCSGSAPFSLLTPLFLLLGDIVPTAPTKPGPLSWVSSLLPC